MSDNKFASLEEKASYGIGRQLGDQLAANPFDGLVIEAVKTGVADAFAGTPSQVAEAELNEAFQVIAGRIQEAREAQSKELSAAGDAFLAENAKRDGVTVTESGLQYEVIAEGNGEKPTKESTVRVHYHGTLIDGTVFDSSVERDQPAEFPVGGVIAGWTEALQLMPVGAKFKLTIPHQIAYGERGAGGAIGPYSALIFEVELLEILA